MDNEENRQEEKEEKVEFSKWLLIQESALIWITTIAFIVLAFICVANQFFGELPWISVMAGLPWAAYGVSQIAYYDKAKKENTKDGIKYETVLKNFQNNFMNDDDIPLG